MLQPKWLPLLFYICYNVLAMKDKRIKTYNIILCGLMAAIMCILAPLSIPMTVPVTLGTFVIFLMTYIMNYKYCLVSCVIYILLGMVGLPVFSGFSGGLGKIIGPTGGYILGYLFIALICGYVNERFYNKRGIQILGMLISLIVCYAFGTLWFSYQQNMSVGESLIVCVYPFVIGDICKIICAAIVGDTLRKRINIRRNI